MVPRGQQQRGLPRRQGFGSPQDVAVMRACVALGREACTQVSPQEAVLRLCGDVPRGSPPRGCHLGARMAEPSLGLGPISGRTARAPERGRSLGFRQALWPPSKKPSRNRTELGERTPRWAPGTRHHPGISRRAPDSSAGVWTTGAQGRVDWAPTVPTARTRPSQAPPGTTSFLIQKQP